MRYRVLLVEDQAIHREILRQALGSYVALTEALDGESAVQLAKSTQPHLVIVDLELPGMSGLQVLEQLMHLPDLAETEYIIVSVLDDDDCMRRAAQLGVANYLTKPIDAQELQEVVAMLLPGVLDK